MTREEAIKVLMNDGWNYDGADAIVEGIEDLLPYMNEENVLEVSEDYKDR